MKQSPPCWDVLAALREISIALLRHERSGTLPAAPELQEWAHSIGEASHASQGLIIACQDIVETGVTDNRIAAMKSALTRALGQVSYTAREDRW